MNLAGLIDYAITLYIVNSLDNIIMSKACTHTSYSTDDILMNCLARLNKIIDGIVWNNERY